MFLLGMTWKKNSNSSYSIRHLQDFRQQHQPNKKQWRYKQKEPKMKKQQKKGYYSNELKAIQFIKQDGRILTFSRIDNIVYIYDSNNEVIKKIR